MLVPTSKHVYILLTATFLVILVTYAALSTRYTLILRLSQGNQDIQDIQDIQNSQGIQDSQESQGAKETQDNQDSQASWIDKGPEGQAEDKAVILAKIQSEDVSWVTDQLPDWQHAIYYMDEPDNGTLHPPQNKGREAMAYLTFLIDHYDNLPATMVFVHAHLQGWPTAWHTDANGYNNVRSIQSLKIDYLQEHGYVNMRCLHNPGCPAEIQVLRNDEERTAEHAMRDAWPYMFGGNMSDIPQKIGQPCCSQFAVSKTQVLQRERKDYQRYRQWLLDTPYDDAASGRVFEYLWHVFFGREAVYCPSVRQCHCEQFGRC